MSQLQTWRKLFSVSQRRAPAWMCQSHQRGWAALGLSADEIPDPHFLSEKIEKLTQWKLTRVKGEVPAKPFFELLARRQFPLAFEMRPLEQTFAAADPDFWHEVYGHLPILLDPQIGDLYMTLGRLGCESKDPVNFEMIWKIFWYFAEYGLMREDGRIKIIGAGLAASPLGVDCLEHESARIKKFSLNALRKAHFNPYQFQGELFCLHSLSELSELLKALES